MFRLGGRGVFEIWPLGLRPGVWRDTDSFPFELRVAAHQLHRDEVVRGAAPERRNAVRPRPQDGIGKGARPAIAPGIRSRAPALQRTDAGLAELNFRFEGISHVYEGHSINKLKASKGMLTVHRLVVI